MGQVQLQLRPVAVEFLTGKTREELAGKVTDALKAGRALHGDWQHDGDDYVQAVVDLAWCPVPEPRDPNESGIVVPRPRSILG